MKRPNLKRLFLAAVFLLMILPASAHADDGVGLIMRGVAKTLFSAVQIPLSIMEDSTQVMFPFGIITGTLKGTMKTLVGTLSGAGDLLRGGGPYAKYALLA